MQQTHLAVPTELRKRRRKPNLAAYAFPGVELRPNAQGNHTIIWHGKNPATGKKTSKTLGTTETNTPGEIDREVARIIERQQRGMDVRSAVMTVSEGWDQSYLPHIKKTLASWADHVSRFECHIRKKLGTRPLHSVTLGELNELIDNLEPVAHSSRRPDHLSPASINRVIDLLKAYFSYMVKTGHLEVSPAWRLQKRREMNARQRVLNAEELLRLGKALLRAPRHVSCLVRLALATGMRLGEMLNARFSDVDFENATLLLRKTKSGRSRLVAIPEEGMAVIQALFAHRKNDWLFPSARGDGPMSRPTRAFNKLLSDSGISDLTIHDCRRVHGSIAIQGENVAVIDVSRHLGHHSTAVTERSYLVACDQRIRHAASQASREISRRLSRGLLIPSCRSTAITNAVRFVMSGNAAA